MTSQRGGAGRGQGRKPLAKTGELMKSRPVRMTDEEWEKCKRLGGAAWVRSKIKEAPDQTATKAKGLSHYYCFETPCAECKDEMLRRYGR